MCHSMNIKVKKSRNPKEKIVVNNQTMLKYWCCNIYKREEEFYESNKTKCRQCLREVMSHNPRSYVTQIIASAKKRHKKHFSIEGFTLSYDYASEQRKNVFMVSH